MHVCEKILEKLHFPIIIWKDKKCMYTNKIKCDTLENYLETNKSFKKFYDIVFDKKEEVIFIYENYSIILNYVIDDMYYETRIKNEKYDNRILMSISNKLRESLTNIIGILSLFKDTKLTKKQMKYLSIIHGASYEIVSVANDLVDIININNKNIILIEKDVNLKKCIDTTCTMLKTNLDIQYKIINTVPVIIKIDEVRLKQILINILNNSIKYTKLGGIALEISLFNNSVECPFPYKSTKPKYNILFKIKDTGTGINKQNIEAINNTLGISSIYNTKSINQGGVGLMIAKEICSLMGGNIWFKSEFDIGTIFYFNIVCDGY